MSPIRAKKSVLSKNPATAQDAFIQAALAAHEPRAFGKILCSQVKKITQAQEAFILLAAQGREPAQLLAAPSGISLPEPVPPGIVQWAARQRKYVARLGQGAGGWRMGASLQTGALKPTSSAAAWGARWQRDVLWLGSRRQSAFCLLVPLTVAAPAGRTSPNEGDVLILLWQQKAPALGSLGQWENWFQTARLAWGQLAHRQQMELRLRQSAAVSEIAQNINATLDLDILLRLIILEITKAVQCQGGDIWLKHEKQSQLVFSTSLGLSQAVRGRLLAAGATELAMATGEAVWLEHAGAGAGASPELLHQEGIASLTVLPLKTKNRIIGAMHLYAKQQRGFTAGEQNLLKTLSNQAASAIDNARLFAETKRKAQELLALYEVAQVIADMPNLNLALEQIVERVSEVLNVEKCWYLFYDREHRTLNAHPAAVGLDEDQIEDLRLPVDEPGVSAGVFHSNRPMFTNSASEEPELQEEFRGLFTLRNLMAVALRGQEETWGVLLAANKRDAQPFDGNDVRLFKTLASEAAMVIQNANLYDQLRRSYYSMVRMISDIVDEREPYYPGHSERVARYAADLAQEMELKADEVERVRMAGLLHDLGKIGISETILMKSGDLSADENMLMQQHPGLGVHILENVEFPWDVKELILHHHETFDGQGYPEGLAGESIPLGARIIAVADTFDILTSKQSQLEVKTPEAAREILLAGTGTRFDPRILTALQVCFPLWLKQFGESAAPPRP